MTFNVAFHLAIYLLAGLHVVIGALVGGVYLRVLLRTPRGRRVKLHASHVVPVSFGWSAAVFAEGYNTLRDADLALPVLWTDYVLLAGLLSVGFAVAVLMRERTFGRVPG